VADTTLYKTLQNGRASQGPTFDQLAQAVAYCMGDQGHSPFYAGGKMAGAFRTDAHDGVGVFVLHGGY
jgi:hypothetical protein